MKHEKPQVYIMFVIGQNNSLKNKDLRYQVYIMQVIRLFFIYKNTPCNLRKNAVKVKRKTT